MSTTHPVLIGGQWQPSRGVETFVAVNPATGRSLPDRYPVSTSEELDQILEHAAAAAETVRKWPGERFATFLEAYANKIEAIADQLIETAHLETGLAVAPRLKDAELPRTTSQLRQAAAAARDGSWAQPTIDTATNIRSLLEPIGPVAVFGPNNFPFAYNGAAGGDFASAVAAGNPVIAKSHPSHPTTTRLFAEAAHAAATETGMPPGFFQMFYNCDTIDGVPFVKSPLLGAVGFTGSRNGGMALKNAADSVGKPIYLEMSSVNPVFLLPGAVAKHGAEIVDQFVGSCLMACGQFCTSPGLVFVVAGPETEDLIQKITERIAAAPVNVLLNEGVQRHLTLAVESLAGHGAKILTGGNIPEGPGIRFENTFLRTSSAGFLRHQALMQAEVFGNASLVVVADSADDLLKLARILGGNLTGSIYSATDGADDDLYLKLEDELRPKVGRLLNDKMPTGVAVVASMNHGGPFPSTGHPGFTAVGFPASIRRFARLACYDAVRPGRLPLSLQDKNPSGQQWRLINGQFTQGDAG